MKEIDKLQKWLDKNSKRDYSNKTVVITGGNSGIGFYLASILAMKHANIILPVRNKSRGEEAKRLILESYPDAKITLMDLDLSSFKSIEKFVNDIINNNIDIDIFVNNAGVFHMPKSQTKDGLELTIGTNFIGVKYLNDLLKDYLLSLKHQVEVIFTTSVASYRGRINYDDFMLDKKYNKFRSYCNSKLCVTHYFIEYIKEVENTNIKTYLTHPGTTYTPLIKKAYPGIFGSIAKVGMRILFHLPNKACLGMVLALEKQKDHAYYAPRGLLEVSGYPKEVKIRKRLYKNQDKTIKISTEIIQKCKANS